MGASDAARGENIEIRHERKIKVFIDSLVDKCNVYNDCSKLRPPTVFGSVGVAVGEHFQKCHVLHARVRQI